MQSNFSPKINNNKEKLKQKKIQKTKLSNISSLEGAATSITDVIDGQNQTIYCPSIPNKDFEKFKTLLSLERNVTQNPQVAPSSGSTVDSTNMCSAHKYSDDADDKEEAVPEENNYFSAF